MSASWTSASRDRGQYSQIWLSHLILLPLTSSSLSLPSLTSLLNCAPWSTESSRSAGAADAACDDRDKEEEPSNSWTRRRTRPSVSHAAPRFAGREAATSRRMRLASLHPRPLVVTPIWRGPSVWVLRRESVQRWGLSTTLTGMRFRLQRAEMRGPITC